MGIGWHESGHGGCRWMGMSLLCVELSCVLIGTGCDGNHAHGLVQYRQQGPSLPFNIVKELVRF